MAVDFYLKMKQSLELKDLPDGGFAGIVVACGGFLSSSIQNQFELAVLNFLKQVHVGPSMLLRSFRFRILILLLQQ
jgi:hypothetical protein